MRTRELAVILAVGFICGSIASTSVRASEAEGSHLELKATAGRVWNPYPLPGPTAPLTSDTATRYGFGAELGLPVLGTLGAELNLQSGGTSALESAFGYWRTGFIPEIGLLIKLGIRRHYVGYSNGFTSTTVSENAFAGMGSLPANIGLGGGFSVHTVSIRGDSPFDGFVSWDMKSANTVGTWGVPIGLAKELGLLELEVRSGYHQMFGGGGVSSKFIPVLIGAQLKPVPGITAGAAYEFPGNFDQPTFTEAEEYYLFERSLYAWVRIGL